jgi:DNA-binding transcriptional ArsR family regulator
VDQFGALADPVRRSLLAELATGPCRVVDLASHRSISRPAVSKHLRLLSEAGLVEASVHGRERHYTVRRQGLTSVQAFVAELLRSGPQGPDVARALDALDTEVRRAERDRRSQAAGSATSRPDEEIA